MKLLLGALAAVVVASVAFVQPAEARCFWNGFGWQCNNGPQWDRGWHRGWDHGYRQHPHYWRDWR